MPRREGIVKWNHGGNRGGAEKTQRGKGLMGPLFRAVKKKDLHIRAKNPGVRTLQEWIDASERNEKRSDAENTEDHGLSSRYQQLRILCKLCTEKEEKKAITGTHEKGRYWGANEHGRGKKRMELDV